MTDHYMRHGVNFYRVITPDAERILHQFSGLAKWESDCNAPPGKIVPKTNTLRDDFPKEPRTTLLHRNALQNHAARVRHCLP